MDSPRRDLAIGGVGGGPSLLNSIENQRNRLEERSPRRGHSIREPSLRWREKGVSPRTERVNFSVSLVRVPDNTFGGLCSTDSPGDNFFAFRRQRVYVQETT